MRNLLGFLLTLLLILLVLLLIFGVGFGLVTLFVTGVAWVLRWAFPFTVFEAMLLGAVLSACTLYVVLGIIRFFFPVESLRLPTMGGEEEEDGEVKAYKRIATSRFYKSTETRTWEAWLREEIANDIYVEFQDEPRTVSNMNETQVQELSIRLSELALTILKRKTARVRDLTMNVSTLKRELQRMGQRAYDDKILQLAVNAINTNVDFFEEDILEVIRTQSWQAPADTPVTE
jgi:hypothetical protein